MQHTNSALFRYEDDANELRYRTDSEPNRTLKIHSADPQTPPVPTNPFQTTFCRLKWVISEQTRPLRFVCRFCFYACVPLAHRRICVSAEILPPPKMCRKTAWLAVAFFSSTNRRKGVYNDYAIWVNIHYKVLSSSASTWTVLFLAVA